jgi:hypothetical protein
VKLWDLLMIRDELDILEAHLTEYEDTDIWRHVIVEAPLTFTGQPKPLYYAENKERFAPWADRIIHLVDDELPETHDPWVRERHQRDFAMRGLEGSTPDDVLIVADVDELLFHETLKALPDPLLGVGLQLLYGAVDRLGNVQVMSSLARRGVVSSLNEVRERRESYPRIELGGWHLSWLGGPEVIRRKALSFSHTEAVPKICGDGSWPGIAYEMWAKGWVEADGETYPGTTDVDPDVTWPKWIWESWDPVRGCRRPEGPAPAAWFRPRESAC